MSAVDPAQVEQAKLAPITADTRRKARRALNVMKAADPDFTFTEDTVVTWRALRAVLPKESRITANLLRSQQSTVQRKAAVGKKYHMQYEAACKHPDPRAFQYLVNPRDVPDLPSGVDPDAVWVAQWKCDPDWLGGDAWHINCEAAAVRTLTLDDQGGSGAPPSLSDRSPGADAPSPAPAGGGGGSPPQAEPRTEGGGSPRTEGGGSPRASEADAANDSGDEDVAVTMKKLCGHLKARAEQQRIAKAHLNDTGSVQFWAERFAADLVKKTPPPAPRDVSAQTFILKTLRGAPCYDDLAPFAAVIERWVSWQGNAAPVASWQPLGSAIIELHATPVQTQIALGAQLDFKEQRKFLSSPLVADLQRKQLAMQIDVLKTRCAHGVGPAAAREQAGELVKNAERIGTKSQMQEVSLARAMGGTMPEEEKVAYLVAEPERWETLRPWWPKHEYFDHMHKVVSGAKSGVKDMDLDFFIEFAPRVYEREELLKLVANPTTRAVLMTMKNLSGRASAATGSSGQTGLGNANVAALPDPLNGTEEQLKEWADMWECIGQANKAILAKESTSLGPLLRALKEHAEQAAKAAKDAAKATEDAGQQRKDESKAGKRPADGAAAGAPDPKKARSPPLQVGDIFYLTVMKKKEDWENCKAEVTRISPPSLTSELTATVEMLGGNKKGRKRGVLLTQIRLAGDGAAAANGAQAAAPGAPGGGAAAPEEAPLANVAAAILGGDSD
ncbi:unnamed protein product [Prorocentrum cordatum]|uniref:Uncharacterized protein n=1 Tax=Prorocentrum cordatum TaxID=2364126 RepID=A0ABN9PZ74_9DINO|nr:unnamed protein product [Polarella glacialis]